MKTVIVGGTSSLGRALKPVLSEFSEVITVGRKNCDINFDLKDPIEKIILPKGIETVIHTAAGFGGKTAKEIVDTEAVNVLGTLKICQAAVQAKAKHFILISSVFSLLKEDSIHYNIYALSKRHSEEAARLFCTIHSLPLTILRPSQIYGSEEIFRTHQPFLYTIIDKAEKGDVISLYGSNDALRNFIHIEDLTQMIAKVVRNKIEGTYTCAQTKDVSYSQIAKAAFSAFNRKENITFLKEKSDIPDNIFPKDDSLYTKIDFYPQVSIEEGMKKIALYRKENK